MLAGRRLKADARFLTLLSSWLASLPPDEWEGMSHELVAFAERRKLVASLPTCLGPKVAAIAGLVADCGFILTHCRTKHARILRFAHLPPAEGTYA